MKSKIIFLLIFLSFGNCGFLPIDYYKGGAEIYGDKECWFHHGVGKDGMFNKYNKNLQQYCAISDRFSDEDLRKLNYEKCNSCDEFMSKHGYFKKQR